jgi:hypothetical protein
MDDKAKIALEITLEIIKNNKFYAADLDSNEEIGIQAAILFNSILEELITV